MASPRVFSILLRRSTMFSSYSSKRLKSRLYLTDKRKTEIPMEVLGSDPCSDEIKLLWNIRDKYSDGDSRNALLANSQFQTTCQTIMKNLRFLRPDQVRSLAYLVFSINLPINMGLTKGVLQMIRVHLNEFDADSLADIYMILKRVESLEPDQGDPEKPDNPVFRALLEAIPKAIEIKLIGKQFHADDPNKLLRTLKVAIKSQVDIEAIRFLLKILTSKLKLINADGYNEIIARLSHHWIESNLEVIGRSLVQNILNQCFYKVSNFLKQNNLEMDYYFDETLKALSLTKDPIYYNEAYCDTIYKVAEKFGDLSNLNAFDAFLSFALKYDHYSEKALEKLASLMVKNPEVFLWESSMSTANIIQIFGRMNWRPSNVDWNLLSPLLLESVKLSTSSYYSPMGTMKSLLILKDHESFEFIADLESCDILDKSLEPSPQTDEKFYQDIITLNIGTTLEATDYTPDQLKKALIPITHEAINYLDSVKVSSPFQQSLSTFLKLTVGGSNFVKNDVWSKYGHFIENLIMIDKNGHPVEIGTSTENQKITLLENLPNLSELDSVAVIPMTDHDFCFKPYKLLGDLEIRVRTLEKLGVRIVKIHYDSWETLSDREKCLYLERELEETVGRKIVTNLHDRVNLC